MTNESFKGKTYNLLPIQVPSTSVVRLSIQSRGLEYHLLKNRIQLRRKKKFLSFKYGIQGFFNNKKAISCESDYPSVEA